MKSEEIWPASSLIEALDKVGFYYFVKECLTLKRQITRSYIFTMFADIVL